MIICPKCETQNQDGAIYCKVCGNMVAQKKSDFHKSCLLIKSNLPNNTHFGTGFVIHHSENSSWIATCAHVINDVGGFSALDVNGSKATISSVVSKKDLDLAIIHTEKRLDIPVLKLGTYGLQGTPFITAGFQIFGKHYSIKQISGNLIQQNELISNSLTERIKVWSLSISGEENLQNGYSGAPVIEDENGFCVGIISYKQGDGKKGLAISIDELTKILPTIPFKLIEKPNRSDSESTHLDYLFRKATELQITGELGQALEILKKVKSFDSTYPRIDSKIHSIETELKKGYVDNNGKIIQEKILVPHYPKMDVESNKSYSSRSNIGCLALFILLIIIAVIFAISIALLGPFIGVVVGIAVLLIIAFLFYLWVR